MSLGQGPSKRVNVHWSRAEGEEREAREGPTPDAEHRVGPPTFFGGGCIFSGTVVVFRLYPFPRALVSYAPVVHKPGAMQAGGCCCTQGAGAGGGWVCRDAIILQEGLVSVLVYIGHVVLPMVLCQKWGPLVDGSCEPRNGGGHRTDGELGADHRWLCHTVPAFGSNQLWSGAPIFAKVHASVPRLNRGSVPFCAHTPPM